MDKQITFERVIDVDHKKAFEVVSNFDKYAEFIPGCSGSSLIERTVSYTHLRAHET